MQCKRNFTLLLITLCLLLVSCNFFQPKNKKVNGKIVAQAYDKYLYESDIQLINFEGTSEADSLALLRQYVDKWLKNNAILYQASEQLQENELTKIESKIKDYKQSLLMYSYEKALISQKMDTNINKIEMLRYFQNNIKDFRANEYLINVKYLIIPNKVAELDEVKEWFNDLDLDSSVVEELQDIAFKYNSTHNFAGQWFNFDEFIQKLNVKTKSDPERFLKNNKKLAYSDSLNTYLVKIDKYTLIGDVLDPMYCLNDIKILMLNIRQKQFLQETKNNIYQAAVNQNKVQVYYDSKKTK